MGELNVGKGHMVCLQYKKDFWIFGCVEIQREEFPIDVVILPVVLPLMRTSASVKQTEKQRERDGQRGKAV